MKKQLDTEEISRRARSMSDAALIFSRKDANEAAQAADAMERAGYRVEKDGGYYRDEATIYALELRRRQK